MTRMVLSVGIYWLALIEQAVANSPDERTTWSNVLADPVAVGTILSSVVALGIAVYSHERGKRRDEERERREISSVLEVVHIAVRLFEASVSALEALKSLERHVDESLRSDLDKTLKEQKYPVADIRCDLKKQVELGRPQVTGVKDFTA